MLHVECLLLSGLLCSPPSIPGPASVMGCKVAQASSVTLYPGNRHHLPPTPIPHLIYLLLTPTETACRLNRKLMQKLSRRFTAYNRGDVSITRRVGLSVVRTASQQERLHFVEINYFPQDAHVSIHCAWPNG